MPNQTYQFDPHRPSFIPPDAKSSHGKCILCGQDIWTSFVRLQVTCGPRRTYTARAHTSCYHAQER